MLAALQGAALLWTPLMTTRDEGLPAGERPCEGKKSCWPSIPARRGNFARGQDCLLYSYDIFLVTFEVM